MRWPVVLLLVLPVLAGCLGGAPTENVEPDVEVPATPSNLSNLSFAEPLLLDRFRAGGEPVVLALEDDTVLVSSHPGWTHVKGADPGLAMQNGQVHLWRSEDGGESFGYVGPAGTPVPAPRDRAIGVSDPDLSVGPSGKVYLSQLYAASTSLSWSTDRGETWTANTAPFPAGDRNWVAAGPEEDRVYHTYRCGDMFRSTDGGRTWTEVGNPGVDGNFAVGPNGTIYCRGPLFGGGSQLSLAVSEDGGEQFDARPPHWTVDDFVGLHMNEPAVDAEGNVYLTWNNRSGVWFGFSRDRGSSWSKPIHVRAPDTASVWPWITAGDEGRVGIVWLEAEEGPTWYVESAVVVDATTPNRTILRSRVTPDPVHVGPLCQGGTACQLGTGDRKMGDFFTADIGPDGRLHVATGTTEHTINDGLSHPLYVRQTGGPKLAGLSSGNATR